MERADGSTSPWVRPASVIIKTAMTWKTRIRRSLKVGDLCLQMTEDQWNQQCREFVTLKTYQARTKELDRDLKSPPCMAEWSMAILLDPMAEVSECLGSQVEESRLNRWTSVGYVKVLGHSARHGPFTIMHECLCSSLTPKDDFVWYLARNSSLQRLEERRQEHESFAPSVKRRLLWLLDHA